jgi:hypothetical protein
VFDFISSKTDNVRGCAGFIGRTCDLREGTCTRPMEYILPTEFAILEAAVAFARGIEGVMLPVPEMADPVHSWALLTLAEILEHEEPAF